MKLNPDFILKKLNNESVVVATGEASKKFYGIINVNETCAFLLENLKEDKTEEELADILAKEYEIDIETAKQDVADFIKSALDAGILDE